MLDVRGDVPEPFVVTVPLARVHRQIGVELSAEQVARLIEPIGFKVMEEVGAGLAGGPGASGFGSESLVVEVPTNRPDVRPEPFGVDDVIEEIARAFGYSNVPRHMPTWPQPGGLTALQRSRRLAKDVLCGLGASEGWTDTFVSAAAHADVGLTGSAVRVANPLDTEKPYLRRSLMPGLLGALAYNADRRQPDVRLYEVGVVFSHPGEGAPRVVERAGAGGLETAELPGERELLCAVFAQEEDDARFAVVSWQVLADAFRIDRVRLIPAGNGLPPLPGLHPTRSAHLVVPSNDGAGNGNGSDGHDGILVIGSVGEIDPDVATTFGLTRTSGTMTEARRIGWLEVDLGLLFDEVRVPRRHVVASAVSRFPSSDIDLAFLVDDRYATDVVADTLRTAAGDLLESVRLFDVYRGPGIAEGARSLAYRLRFCSPVRTLTDEEVGQLRAQCIAAVEEEYGAVLR
jgi:phenylalanyl-tRNA synthetase beta chain